MNNGKYVSWYDRNGNLRFDRVFSNKEGDALARYIISNGGRDVEYGKSIYLKRKKESVVG